MGLFEFGTYKLTFLEISSIYLIIFPTKFTQLLYFHVKF
jgi:hypothetical protein